MIACMMSMELSSDRTRMELSHETHRVGMEAVSPETRARHAADSDDAPDDDLAAAAEGGRRRRRRR